MARSVVLETTPRCEKCRCTPRWCICAGWRPVDTPLQVDVLIHKREYWRPTSTGRLINRVVTASRGHVFWQEKPPVRDSVAMPGRELWILHPRGEAAPAGADPEKVQVLLLDGSWSEAGSMLEVAGQWGRRVSLPLTGPSRYWLRNAPGAGKHATAEALLGLFAAFGLGEAETQLRLQFELHVYAGLRTRGAKALADEFLATSPLRTAMPELLAKLGERRRAR
ncbi:MAG: DTW domain-containing protein [Opitutae bacterium]|nr:DTW domain-containing protein [Opitutae bacterium]